ncbi:MAG: hypothetical protein HY040_00110 [Planctomycetes bacterium]|nr:hypothetical protein [Planctomycetota bacterium]
MKCVILGIMISILLTGCGRGQNSKVTVLKELFKERPDTNVTESPEYNFSSFAGTVWKTKVEVALADLEAYTGRHQKTLLAPQHFDPTHPKYLRPSSMQTFEVLPVGTRLKFERLMFDNGIGSRLWIIALLGDRAHAASFERTKFIYVDRHLLAENRFTFPGSSDSNVWGVNPDLLEKAE